jgi:hypothetical protein
MPAAAENASTRITAGASLKPDSASRVPLSRFGSPMPRSTEKTAAASVEATTAPMVRESCQSKPSRKCAPSAVTATETPTPTVASTPAGATCLEIARHRVERPPSMRMSASANVPSAWASSKSSNGMPTPSSPRTRPAPRNTSSAGSPSRCVARRAAMERSTVTQPISTTRYSWGNVTSGA